MENEIDKLKKEIEILKNINLDLTKKISIAKEWMAKQVKEDVGRISKINLKKFEKETKDSFRD
jgi:hypothetical protein